MTRPAGTARRRQRPPIPPGSIPTSRTWYLVSTPRGRRSPASVWPVTTAAGHTWYLTGLQRAALLWLTSRSGYGRHEAKVVELARAIGCGPGTASKILARLRSLSLIGCPRPTRGRHGGFRYWRPSPGSVRADHARRRVRWPTFANDSTPTPFGGYLTREGMRRSWRATTGDRSGSPPVAAAPRRVASRHGPRARGRPWPPRYTDERCSRDGGRVRLVRITDRGAPAGDLAATYGARCPRCRSPIAASAVLVAPVSGAVAVGTVVAGMRDPSSIGAPAAGPSPLAAAAAAVIPELHHAGQVDRLRIDHLGYRRRQLVIPPIRPAIAGGVDTPLEEVAAAAWSEALADLATVTASRELVRYSHGPSPAGGPDLSVRIPQPSAGDADGHARTAIKSGR